MVMPLVIFLITLLIYLSFFLYNRCIFSQDAYILAFRGSISGGVEGNEIRRYIEDDIGKQLGSKYIGIRDLQKNITISRQEIRVRMEVETGKRWKLEAVGEAHRNNPVEIIRGIRLAKKVGGKLKNKGEE